MLGYLLAGIVIGPTLTFLNVDVIAIQHFAEFGVVMMLFIVGLELEPKALWSMRKQLIGLGGGRIDFICCRLYRYRLSVWPCLANSTYNRLNFIAFFDRDCAANAFRARAIKIRWWPSLI